MTRITVIRADGDVEVALLPHKDGSGWSFINLTKGHICPCKFESKDAAMRDLEAQPNVLAYRVHGVEPLTLEELRQMKGEPVFVVETEGKVDQFKEWCVLDDDRALISGVACFWWQFKDYGKTWLAYRRKPEEVAP